MYGNDYDYAYNRLAGTIVRNGKTGQPVKVLTINNTGNVTCDNMAVGGRVLLKLDDLNLKPVPLGWCNLEATSACYLSRIPMRNDWRQGLRERSTHSTGPELNAIPVKCLSECIMGIYPTIKEILEELPVRSHRIMAWARHWAMSRGSLFYINMEQVGSVVDGKPILSTKFSYLQDDLEESYESHRRI